MLEQDFSQYDKFMILSDEEMQAFLDKLKGWELSKLYEQMHECKKQLDIFKTRKTQLQKVFDFLRLIAIPEKMEEADIENITCQFADGSTNRVALTADMYASIEKGMKEAAIEWLHENDHGGLVTESVNAGSLKSFAKKYIKDGKELPEGLFKVTPYTRASITKVSKK